MLEKISRMPSKLGTKKLSIFIVPSWPEHDEPSVEFGFYKEESSWKVYWGLFSMKESMQKKIKKAIAKQQDVKEVLDDPGFGVSICDDGVICFHEVDAEAGSILDEVCKDGLPEPIRKYRGLDGVSYKILIDGFPKEYRFWMRLPAGWADMKRVIDVCVDYARINKRVYKCGVDRVRPLHKSRK